MPTSKLQKILDTFHKQLASDDSTGKLAPYFRETLNIDHSVSRNQTFDEVMIVEDILLDPFDLNTWQSTIDGLMFSSPIRHTQKTEYYVLSQMTKITDITMAAPAAAAMFLMKHSPKDPNDTNAAKILQAQLDQAGNSQTGYLILNPLVFWQMVEHNLPDTIEPSATNPQFIQFVERYINELMLHEVNHHINGHTILSSPSYTPLKPELTAKYNQHKFALGQFVAESPHALANIIEDFAINEYLLNHMNWPASKDSLFVTGVSTIDPAINAGEHGLSAQPSITSDVLSNIDTSVYERIQAFADSDINIEDSSHDDDDSGKNGTPSQPSTLDELVAVLTSSMQNNSDADMHAASDDQSDIDKEIAQSQLSNAIKNAQDATNSQPGMQGADYARTLNPGTKAKVLPKLSIKLAKIRKAFNNSYHVNWSMPHQILSNRLDLHRIEKDPQNSHIDVWIDTSGSMSQDQLNRLMTLIIANYVLSAKKTPIIVHPVSFGAVGEPITMSSKADVQKIRTVGLASNGGTSFEEVLAELKPGAHIIMSDFEWVSSDITNNMDTLSNKDKKILWINTSNIFYSDGELEVFNAIKSTNQLLIHLSDYEY